MQNNFFLALKSVEGMNEQIQEVFHVPDLKGGELGAHGKKFVNIQADFGDFLKTWKIDK